MANTIDSKNLNNVTVQPSDNEAIAADTTAPKAKVEALEASAGIVSQNAKNSAQSVNAQEEKPTMDPRVFAAKTRSGDGASEYIVMVPVEADADFHKLLTELKVGQTKEQHLTSNPERHRHVLFLTRQQVARLQKSGAHVSQNLQVRLPQDMPLAKSSITPAEHGPTGDSQIQSPNFHGVNNLKGGDWDGEGVLAVSLDTGMGAHKDLKTPYAFDNLYTDEVEGPEKAYDSAQHGSHTIGTMVAHGKPEEGGVRGMAPKADIASFIVLDGGSGTWAGVMSGIEAAIDLSKEYDGPVVVNMSLGGGSEDPENDPLNKLVNEAVSKYGILMCISAGNSGSGENTIGTPGTAELAVTVGAMDHKQTLETGDDKIASFSSRGGDGPGQKGKPDISADGVGVISTVPGDEYLLMSGTSMASPNVAGAAAKLLGKAWKLFKEGTFDTDPRELVKTGQFQQLLKDTARDNPKVEHNIEGEGDLRVDKAADLMLQRFGTQAVDEAVAQFKEAFENNIDPGENVLSTRGVDDILIQLQAPLLSGQLAAPSRRIKYLETVLNFVGEVQAGQGPTKFSDDAAGKIRGLIANSAKSALQDRSRLPYRSPEAAMTTAERFVKWSNVADGKVDAEELRSLGIMASATAAQLSPEDTLKYLTGMRELLGTLPDSAEVDASLFGLAYTAIAERVQGKITKAAHASEIFAEHVEWQNQDKAGTPDQKAQALSQTMAATLSKLTPQEQAVYLGNIRTTAEASIGKGDNRMAKLLPLAQAQALITMRSVAADSQTPFPNAKLASKFVNTFVSWQKRDQNYSADDKTALTEILGTLLQTGTLNEVISKTEGRRSFKDEMNKTFSGLQRSGMITKVESKAYTQRLASAVTEQVRRSAGQP